MLGMVPVCHFDEANCVVGRIKKRLRDHLVPTASGELFDDEQLRLRFNGMYLMKDTHVVCRRHLPAIATLFIKRLAFRIVTEPPEGDKCQKCAKTTVSHYLKGNWTVRFGYPLQWYGAQSKEGGSLGGRRSSSNCRRTDD